MLKAYDDFKIKVDDKIFSGLNNIPVEVKDWIRAGLFTSFLHGYMSALEELQSLSDQTFQLRLRKSAKEFAKLEFSINNK